MCSCCVPVFKWFINNAKWDTAQGFTAPSWIPVAWLHTMHCFLRDWHTEGTYRDHILYLSIWTCSLSLKKTGSFFSFFSSGTCIRSEFFLCGLVFNSMSFNKANTVWGEYFEYVGNLALLVLMVPQAESNDYLSKKLQKFRFLIGNCKRKIYKMSNIIMIIITKFRFHCWNDEIIGLEELETYDYFLLTVTLSVTVIFLSCMSNMFIIFSLPLLRLKHCNNMPIGMQNKIYQNDTNLYSKWKKTR